MKRSTSTSRSQQQHQLSTPKHSMSPQRASSSSPPVSGRPQQQQQQQQASSSTRGVTFDPSTKPGTSPKHQQQQQQQQHKTRRGSGMLMNASSSNQRPQQQQQQQDFRQYNQVFGDSALGHQNLHNTTSMSPETGIYHNNNQQEVDENQSDSSDNDDTNHNLDRQTAESGSYTTGSGSDDNDPDNDGFSNVRSSVSGGTGSSKSKALAARSSLPCGMTMPVLMTLVIMIPIIFLVTYTALPLDEAIRADNFLDEHRDAFDAIREAALVNFYENFNASYFLFYVINDNPLQALAKNRTDVSRAIFDKHMRTLVNVMRYSDVQGQDRILNTLEEVQTEMAVERKLVDDTSILGPPYRQRQIRLMDKLTRVLLAFSKDPRCRLLRHHLLIYTVVRLMSLHLTSSAASAEAIIVAGSDPYLYYSNAMNLQSRYDSIVSKLAFTIEASEGDAERLLIQLRDAPVWQRWTELAQFLLVDQNATRWSHLSAANASRWFSDVNFYVSQIDSEVLEAFTDGKLLEEVVVREALLMAFALLGCVLALAAVIYYNQKEQKRMERALDATAVLADAVQRFVPRNQLKTMGVRSITQVQPGMSTEVAQTITFSDIRQFTRLSESMSRLELFEWLQNYVSRMTKVISEEKSYIMAFLGDGLGICSPQPTYAVNAAIKMHVAVEALNLDIVAKGGTLPVQIGVGIHHGVVVAGVFGDSQRLSVSMVAPDVNFASRLEALTKSFGVKILASEDVIYQISSDVFAFRNVGRVQVSGSSQAVKVYDIYQADSLKTKIFKSATKEEFENAIALLDTDRPQADRTFEQLVMKARMEGLHDLSSEIYYRRKDTNGASDQSSVLSFEKDGSFANFPMNHNGSFPSSPLDGSKRKGGTSFSEYNSKHNDSDYQIIQGQENQQQSSHQHQQVAAHQHPQAQQPQLPLARSDSRESANFLKHLDETRDPEQLHPFHQINTTNTSPQRQQQPQQQQQPPPVTAHHQQQHQQHQQPPPSPMPNQQQHSNSNNGNILPHTSCSPTATTTAVQHQNQHQNQNQQQLPHHHSNQYQQQQQLPHQAQQPQQQERDVVEEELPSGDYADKNGLHHNRSPEMAAKTATQRGGGGNGTTGTTATATGTTGSQKSNRSLPEFPYNHSPQGKTNSFDPNRGAGGGQQQQQQQQQQQHERWYDDTQKSYDQTTDSNKEGTPRQHTNSNNNNNNTNGFVMIAGQQSNQQHQNQQQHHQQQQAQHHRDLHGAPPAPLN